MPRAFEGRIQPSRNTALLGAMRRLVDESAQKEAKRLVTLTQTVDLSCDPVFMDAYVENMFFSEYES